MRLKPTRLSLVLLALGAAVVGGGLALRGWQQGNWSVPETMNPWAPLRVDAQPNWLTDFKLDRARRDPLQCSRLVAALDWQASPLPNRITGPGCGFDNAWHVRTTGTLRLGQPLSLACPAVLSLAMWERHTLQAAAQRHFEAPVRSLHHAGSYACRNVYGRSGAARSLHATAQALDVTGFRIADGRAVSVKADWGRDGPAGRFLRDVQQGACRWFDGVLGPGYNAEHADHFHLEVGGRRSPGYLRAVALRFGFWDGPAGSCR